MWWAIGLFLLGSFIWGCFDQKRWQQNITEIIKTIFVGGLLLVGAIFIGGGILGLLDMGWHHLLKIPN